MLHLTSIILKMHGVFELMHLVTAYPSSVKGKRNEKQLNVYSLMLLCWKKSVQACDAPSSATQEHLTFSKYTGMSTTSHLHVCQKCTWFPISRALADEYVITSRSVLRKQWLSEGSHTCTSQSFWGISMSTSTSTRACGNVACNSTTWWKRVGPAGWTKTCMPEYINRPITSHLAGGGGSTALSSPSPPFPSTPLRSRPLIAARGSGGAL